MTARLLTLPPVPAPSVLNGRVTGWHDGDTVHVIVDRLDDDFSEWSVRVRGLACLELGEPGGPETRDRVAALAPAGTPVVLVGLDDDKYGGRKLATIVVDLGAGSVDLAEYLVLDGWALPWDGRGEQPKLPWPRVAPALPVAA
jgi:endonuclease YncB( thermonuclease family)